MGAGAGGRRSEVEEAVARAEPGGRRRCGRGEPKKVNMERNLFANSNRKSNGELKIDRLLKML